MTDFVLQRRLFITSNDISESDLLAQIFLYAKFLKQPLELWMFVPFDDEGNVLEEPEENDLNGSFLKMQINYDKEVKWEIAKERCLFEGFEESKVKDIMKFADNIEDISKFNLQLTETAIKQLGL